MKPELLRAEHLTKYFPSMDGKGTVHAVEDVSLFLEPGETLGVVGESGCGKSTLARVLLRLIEPTSGNVYLRGKDLCALKLLEMVGLEPEATSRYPHEFSGGQRQRIGIARAIALEPELVIADEPVSALDVSIQSQVLNLLVDLRRQLGLSMIFISHDLAVVEHLCNRIAVMYLGEIVEMTDCDTLFSDPKHPYTEALLSAIPRPDPTYRGSRRIVLKGDIPSPENPPEGCRFHTRCSKATALCASRIPEEYGLGSSDRPHMVRCHLYA